jgi:hypothetical protein
VLPIHSVIFTKYYYFTLFITSLLSLSLRIGWYMEPDWQVISLYNSNFLKLRSQIPEKV